MEALAARIAAFCLQKHYIEPDQIAWLQYGLMRRLMGMVTFLLLLPVGAFFDGWRSTFLFLLVFRFIRMRTGGYHAKTPAEQSEFRTAGYDMWSRMEPQNEKLMAAMQQLSLKERFVVTEYALKGKPFKEIAQETGLKEKGVASAYYRSIKKLRAEMGDVK